MDEKTLLEEYTFFHSQKIRPYQHSYSNTTSYNWYYRARRDPYNRFYVVSGGQGLLENRSESIELLPGFAYFIPRGTVYTMSTETGLEKFWVHFDWEVLPGLDGGDFYDKCFSYPWPIELTRSWEKWCDSSSPGKINYLKGALWTLLGSLVEESGSQFKGGMLRWEKYKPLLNLLVEGKEKLTVTAMADCLAMSQATLYRSFQKDFSLSPQAWLLKQTMDEGEKLLLHSSLSIKEISFRLGYEDPSYFSRIFSKQRGMNPLKFRKEYTYLPSRAGKKPFWDIDVND